MDSTNAVADPMSAMTHIQKTAPGPPSAMAVATPARFPVPTRVATETAKAWKDVMCRCCWSLVVAVSVRRRNISRIMRNCTPRVFHVNHSPHATSMAMRRYPHKASLICVISWLVMYYAEMVKKLLNVACFGVKRCIFVV